MERHGSADGDAAFSADPWAPGALGPRGPGAVYLRLLLTDSVLLREQKPRRLGGYGNSFRSILLWRQFVHSLTGEAVSVFR